VAEFFKTHSQAKIHRKTCGIGLSSENALFVAISPISCSFWNCTTGEDALTLASGAAGIGVRGGAAAPSQNKVGQIMNVFRAKIGAIIEKTCNIVFENTRNM
jgi:hypothetical protein